MEIVVPDLGDFSDVEVIECLVNPGDEILAETPLITIETDKAAMDVPSPAAGRLIKLTVAVGDRVSAGDVIAEIEATSDAEQAGGKRAADSSPSTAESGIANEPTGAAVTTDSATPAAVSAKPLDPVALTVPDLGDFADVEIIEVLVAPGDAVAKEQGLITVETDKAAMDVPSSLAGSIISLSVAVGGRVSTGDVIGMIQPDAVAASAAIGQETAAASATKATATENAPAPARAAATTAIPQQRAMPPIDERSFGAAHASPSIRKLARELGVNLGSVQGSGKKGRVTSDDVKSYVKQVMLGGGFSSGPALPTVPDVDHAKFGEVETIALTRIQRISGPRLHASWVNLPHVTQHDLADFSDTEARRKALKAEAAAKDVRLTPLAFIVRGCALALAEFPVFRASLTADGDGLVMKHYTHIGFAADTPNGLVVPVIRDADQKSVMEIAGELGDLSALARDGKLRAAQMQGGVFTISSLGGIGGTYFTPIINAPEVAILGVSRSSLQPVYQGEQFVPRLMLPLSLSYDHRVIDGAQAARFIARLSELLSDPETLLRNPGGDDS